MKMNDKVKNAYKFRFITKPDYLLQKKRNSPNYRRVSNYCLIKSYQFSTCHVKAAVICSPTNTEVSAVFAIPFV